MAAFVPYALRLPEQQYLDLVRDDKFHFSHISPLLLKSYSPLVVVKHVQNGSLMVYYNSGLVRVILKDH